MENILDKLEKELHAETVILGIGNPIRGDDAFGSFLARRIENKICLRVYDGGSSPENLLGKIIEDDPRTVLIIDALAFGGVPGEINLFNPEEIKTSALFFTHNPSPRLIFDFLQENTKAKIYLLAIQPRTINLGDKMTPPIEERLRELTRWFIKNYPLNTCGNRLSTQT